MINSSHLPAFVFPIELRRCRSGLLRRTSKPAISHICHIIKPGETIKIPTGIRVEMDQEWVLKCYPRSGLGFKFRLQLNNTVGIIDSDYFYSDNEGHIFAKLTNDTNENKVVELKADTGFMQGIFVEYGITVDDDVTDVRNGGFGSTTK